MPHRRRKQNWLGFAAALFAHGTVGSFFFGVAPHELGHGTVFRTKWLNKLFLYMFSLLSWWDPFDYASSHTYHHRYTQYLDGDRENVFPLEPSVGTIRAHMAFWDEFDLQGANMEALMIHLEETRNRLGSLWDLHFQIVRAAYGAMNKLNDYYKELFEDHGTFDALKLYQGFDNLTLEMRRAQWDLSRQVVALPGVLAVFEENDVADILEALKTAPEGKVFTSSAGVSAST
jgi:hypothetical protein